MRTLALLAATLLLGACDRSPTGPGERDPGVPRRYTVVRLDTPADPGSFFSPVAMNGLGQVAVTDYAGRYFGVWTEEGFTALPTPALGTATGLNDAGRVVGYITTRSYGNVSTIIEQRPLVGEGGRLWYLTGTGLGRARALAINDAGTVVGGVDRNGRTSGFVLAAGQVTFIDTPGDTAAEAVAVNRAGDVLVNGWRTVRAGSGYASVSRPQVWRNGALVGLGYLESAAAGPGQVVDPSRFSYVARDLNERGEVVGEAHGHACAPDGTQCFARQYAFLWSGGKMIVLGKGYETGFATALAINRWGQVLVTVYGSGPQTMLLWSDGKFHDLNDALQGTGWKLDMVVDLNDRGQIVGTAFREGGGYAVVRLDPA